MDKNGKISLKAKTKPSNLKKNPPFDFHISLFFIHLSINRIGTSDPYVKFKMNGRLLHKSKTVHRDLNPIWDETFAAPIEDPFQIIYIKVFDYDWGLQDDFMGSAKLDLTAIELGRIHELVLRLEDPSRPSKTELGELKLNVTLWPRTQEDKEQVGPIKILYIVSIVIIYSDSL